MLIDKRYSSLKKNRAEMYKRIAKWTIFTICLVSWNSNRSVHCQQAISDQQHHLQQQQNHQSLENLADHLNNARQQQHQQLINHRLASALAILSSSQNGAGNSPQTSTSNQQSISSSESAALGNHINSLITGRSAGSSPSAISSSSSTNMLAAAASSPTPTYASIYSPSSSQYLSGSASSLVNPVASQQPQQNHHSSTATSASSASPLTHGLLYPPIGPLSYGQSHLYGSALANPLASLGGNSLWSAYSSPLYAGTLARNSYSPFSSLYSASPRYSPASGYLSALQSFYGLGSGSSGAGSEQNSAQPDLSSLLRSAGSPYSSLFTRESSLFPSYSPGSMYGAGMGMSPSGSANAMYAGSPYSSAAADPLYTSASNSAYGVASPAGSAMNPMALGHASAYGGAGGPRITIQPLFGSAASSYYSLLNPYGAAGSTGSSALRSSLLGGKLGLGLGLAGLSLLG